MQLDRPEAYETTTELDLMECLLPLTGARALELGCGAAWTTTQLAERYPETQFIATELDVEPERYTEIRLAFMAHMTEDGAHFMKPHRINLLQKPAAE